MLCRRNLLVVSAVLSVLLYLLVLREISRGFCASLRLLCICPDRALQVLKQCLETSTSHPPADSEVCAVIVLYCGGFLLYFPRLGGSLPMPIRR
jgi:hypothetical protein